MTDNADKISAEVMREYLRATSIYGPFNSAHEGYAILLEEVDELKQEIWKKPAKRSRIAMREEAIQIAAMAMRFVNDICDYGPAQAVVKEESSYIDRDSVMQYKGLKNERAIRGSV